MRTLPHAAQMPDAITLEPPANGLAGLAITPELEGIASVVVRQWNNTAVFDKLAKFGVHPIRNVLLYGPPGNGKTTASQWIAYHLKCPLYRIRCESLSGRYLGETGNLMRQTLDWLSKAGRCVVLFDEVETLFPARDSMDGASGREISSAMTQFWQTLDRWSTPQFFCFATNLPSKLDPALLSRFEARIELGPPTQVQIRSVVDYWAEVFHEHSPDSWAPQLAEKPFVSFRELWQSITKEVRAAAMDRAEPS
jgi:ATP-dependent 26S proteasome regulatory subunit